MTLKKIAKKEVTFKKDCTKKEVTIKTNYKKRKVTFKRLQKEKVSLNILQKEEGGTFCLWPAVQSAGGRNQWSDYTSANPHPHVSLTADICDIAKWWSSFENLYFCLCLCFAEALAPFPSLWQILPNVTAAEIFYVLSSGHCTEWWKYLKRFFEKHFLWKSVGLCGVSVVAH